MEPNQTQQQTPGTSQPINQTPPQAPVQQPVDQTALSLSRAIRSVENTGYNQTVQEPNGTTSFGAYGWNQNNFQNWAKQYGLNPADTSQTNQDHLAYLRIKSLLDKGIPQSQVAAIWNGATYKNGQYVANNPNYVTKVKAAYVNETGAQPQLAPGVPALQISGQGQNQASMPDKGFWGDLTSGNLLGAAKNAGNFFFPIAEDIGGDVSGTSQKTALQQAGDLGVSTLSAIALASMLPESLVGAGTAGVVGTLAGTGAETVGGRIGAQALLGSGFAASQALGQGTTDPQKIAQSALFGGALGGGAGAAGELLGKVLTALPTKIARSFIPGINQDTAQYAVNKGLGSISSMFDQSSQRLTDVGTSIGNALKNAPSGVANATQKDIIPNIISQFPNAGLDPASIGAALEKVAPLQKSLIEKLFTQDGLTMDELHTLNSAIGKNTFKTVFDDPVMRAGKDLANAFYHSAGDLIKSNVPETAPLFDEYTKEVTLNQALKKALNRGQKAKMITLKDIVGMLSGLGLTGGNPLGAIGGYAAERALTSPTVNLNAARLMTGLVGLPSLTPLATGLASRSLGSSQPPVSLNP